MCGALLRFHLRVLVPASAPWAMLVGLLMLLNWLEQGRFDSTLEAALAALGCWLSWTVSRTTSRESMQYLCQLPIEKTTALHSPYKTALWMLVVISFAVHLVESTGAMSLTFGHQDLQRRPMLPWINLVGYPILGFALGLTLTSSSAVIKRRVPDVLLLWVALALSILMYPVLLVRVEWPGEAAVAVQRAYAGAVHQNVPGILGLGFGAWLLRRKRESLRQGVERFPIGAETWPG